MSNILQPDNDEYKIISRIIDLRVCRQQEPIMRLGHVGSGREQEQSFFWEFRLVFFCFLTNNGRDCLVSVASRNDAWSMLCVG